MKNRSFGSGREEPVLPISRGRLTAALNAVNRFGATRAGGAERVAWTEAEVAARDWLVHECRAIGLVAEQDEAGNVWAHLRGAPTEPGSMVFLGSHLDTVPNGGRFDGALGVVGALEVLHAAVASDRAIARRLGIVCWTDEEGTRFGLGMLGSRSVAGLVTTDEIEDAVANDGTRLADVLRTHGLNPARVPEAARRRERIGAYLELHIEQGPELDRARQPIGIVTGIVGVSNWRIASEGVANHAGATMPSDRRDALIPIAELALAAQRAMRSRAGLVATVGESCVIGGASNIVPGRARATLDVRSLDASLLDQAVTEILDAVQARAADNGCRLATTETKRMPPVIVEQRMLALLTEAAEAEGLPARLLPSRAAHDGMNLARVGIPIGMVFVRSRGGISHSPAETSAASDCAAGVRVLARAATMLASRIETSGRFDPREGPGNEK